MLAVSYHACNAMKEILNNLLINVIAGEKKEIEGEERRVPIFSSGLVW